MVNWKIVNQTHSDSWNLNSKGGGQNFQKRIRKEKVHKTENANL